MREGPAESPRSSSETRPASPLTDIAVVGGGPAGLAVAIAARLAGLSVVVVDRARPPIDKPCGEGLMPNGVPVLSALGVAPESVGVPFLGIRYVGEDDGAAGPGSSGPVVADGVFLGGPGLGARRTALHAALVARAEALGADLRWGVGATALAEDGVETTAGRLRARVVAGADGLHSRVRRWAGLDAGPGPRRRFGVRRHYAIAPWTDRVEVHWVEEAEAYVTPVAAGETGIALVTGAGQEPHFDRLLERFPALAERLRGAATTGTTRGAGPFHQKARGVIAGGRALVGAALRGPGASAVAPAVASAGAPAVALVGDAGGYLDPITGEGLSLGFRQARALADAVVAGDLARYARAHARIVAPYKRMTGLLLEVQRRPRLRRRVLRALAAQPDAFARLLAINDGVLPLHALAGRAGFAFVGRLLRG